MIYNIFKYDAYSLTPFLTLCKHNFELFLSAILNTNKTKHENKNILLFFTYKLFKFISFLERQPLTFSLIICKTMFFENIDT